MDFGAWRSNASHIAASRKRAAKAATETRFNLDERISGERPTDSIASVKRLQFVCLAQLACPGVGRTLLNVACSMLSNFEPMRLSSISIFIASLSMIYLLD